MSSTKNTPSIPGALTAKLKAYSSRVKRLLAHPVIGQSLLTVKRLGKDLGGEALAGVITALVTIAYCISFSALIFQGDLKDGLALGLWGLLLGAAVTGLYIALSTSLVPAGAGPDTPAIAVMSVLAATIATQVSAQGGTPQAVITHVLLGLTLATLLTGLLLYTIGRLQLGQIVRFVPFPVIGGFLAASGWLMMMGAVTLVTGQEFTVLSVTQNGISLAQLPQIAVAMTFAAILLFARKHWDSILVLPLCFFAMAVLLDLALWLLGLMAPGSSWFISAGSSLQPWAPLQVVFAGDVEWLVFGNAIVEIGAVAGVTLVALLLDVSSLEVSRCKVVDLDAEFRSNGLANLIAAPVGGLSGNLSMQSSKLLAETGATTRAGGVFAALAIAIVLFAGIDLPALVPTAILAGLLIYLGALILAEALIAVPGRRSWSDLAMALLIMFAIVQFGYLVGVILGIIGACLMFAFSYSRIGVVRRHLTRAQFSSHVERNASATQLLRSEGAGIHVFWLSGFIFFGSSNGFFERLRKVIESQTSPAIRYIILDFAAVSGVDTSAILSLVKLRNFCDETDVTLVYSSLSVPLLVAFEQAELFGGGCRHQAFPSRNDAMEWCEDQLLIRSREREQGQGDQLQEADPDAHQLMMSWLQREIGEDDSKTLLETYFQRREIDDGITLYRQGDPSDSIDLVAAGSIAVNVLDDVGRPFRVRRMSGQTVVGEMGFFRNAKRTASVSSEGATVVYTMDRAAYERLLSKQPKLAAAFLQFIIRALSDRVEFANQEIAALI